MSASKGGWTGSNNPRWVGDKASYVVRHQRVKAARGKANGPCTHCGAGTKFEWAQLKGTKGLNTADYICLCGPCHKRYDGHVKFTDEQIEEIQAQRYIGRSAIELAAEYSTNRRYIYEITSHKARRSRIEACEILLVGA